MSWVINEDFLSWLVRDWLTSHLGHQSFWNHSTYSSSVTLSWLHAFVVLHAQLHPTLFDPPDHSLPGASVHGILQARIVKWITMPSSMLFLIPGIKPASLRSLAVAGGSLPLALPGKPQYISTTQYSTKTQGDFNQISGIIFHNTLLSKLFPAPSSCFIFPRPQSNFCLLSSERSPCSAWSPLLCTVVQNMLSDRNLGWPKGSPCYFHFVGHRSVCIQSYIMTPLGSGKTLLPYTTEKLEKIFKKLFTDIGK